MKQIVSISLGSSKTDYEFETEFLGQDFNIKRLGTDGDLEKAAEMLLQWDKNADVIGIGGVKLPYGLNPRYLKKKHMDKLERLGAQIETPVTLGSELRDVSFEWCLRFIQYKFGNYFNNAKVLFLSGMDHYRLAKVMSEFTDNLTFADPIFENGIAKFLTSIKDLKSYAHGVHEILQWIPSKRLASSVVPLKAWNDYIVKKAMQKANIIVVPNDYFYKYLENMSLEELGGKTIITPTAYDDRIEFLKERGVDVVIDTTPKI
ncbi:MAG: dehydrogenase, partial [Deltaproteobacteria bacterium]